MKHVLITMLMLLAFACKKEKNEKPKTDDVLYKVTCDSCYVWFFGNKSIDSITTVQGSWEYHLTKPRGEQDTVLTLGAWEKSKKQLLGVSLEIYYSGELVQNYMDKTLTDTVKPPQSISFVIPKR